MTRKFVGVPLSSLPPNKVPLMGVANSRKFCALIAGLLLGLASAIEGVPLWAGTVRHDQNNRLYVVMADDRAFQAVGQHQVFSPILGIGNYPATVTLIAPQWAIGAAHNVVWDGQAIPGTHVLTINGEQFQIASNDVFVHPEWVLGGEDLTRGFDVALFRLPRPIRTVTAFGLSSIQTPEGAVIASVGYGATGSGFTGAMSVDGKRWAGHNTVDYVDTATLRYDFDSPLRNSSVFGSATPLPLEYSAAIGDSGGPMLLPRRNGLGAQGFYLVGICSGGLVSGRSSGTYGSVTVFARVSACLPWMQSVLQGNEWPVWPMLGAMRKSAEQSAQIETAFAERIRTHADLFAQGISVSFYGDFGESPRAVELEIDRRLSPPSLWEVVSRNLKAVASHSPDADGSLCLP